MEGLREIPTWLPREPSGRTYRVADALAVTIGAARRSGAVRIAVGGGGVAFYSKRRPTNVYLAFPDSDVQIEVYDPSADLARRLVAGGHVRLVTPSSALAAAVPTRVATSRVRLEKLAAALGRPIYWLGALAGARLELTRTADGRVYVLYLPSAVPPGTQTPYLTIATYPLAQGLALTTAASREAGMVRIPLPNGAVAFFSRSRPTNVYVAFRGVGEQIEVFAPAAGRARSSQRSGSGRSPGSGRPGPDDPMTLVLAWIVLPVVLVGLALGCGLLLERLAGDRLPGELLLPPDSRS
jgi:hypothetical protein